ncbi:MAG: Gfo/Idh/MocA family oxidoreductase [Desulfomonile tiedjei]|uniref:Gfo/Idh/MocA family oxidoreductase n=1 Tax=Desulfomonile tiedjei TaxID=2358 RepID=A0A9D6V3Y3_9BACT|nr:Gfo/Idh/MocA family oxidoreductase [Desulfomonile tiedjei]
MEPSTRRTRRYHVSGDEILLNVGLFGYGYWGPNLVRNFNRGGRSRIKVVCDLNTDRLKRLVEDYPSVEGTNSVDRIINDPSIDAVAIATPVSTHCDLAMRALRAGKHVLVEKPIATTTSEALRMTDEADRQKRVLLVDHTFVYTGAVRKIKEAVDSGALGEIYYYDSVRVNLGLFQKDVDVLYDLAVHDLSILEYVLPNKPCAVSATGMASFSGGPENVAYLTLFFDNRCIAHMHVNWLAPVKIRRTLLGGSSKMIVYDDLEPSEKVKIYDKGVDVGDDPDGLYKIKVSYRTGDMWAPKVDTTEALQTLVSHFIDCAENGASPITGGREGLFVVRILEAAVESMRGRAVTVELQL